MADDRESKPASLIYTVAKWWTIGFGAIGISALLAGGTGMLVMPHAQPDPTTFPARFLPIAIVAFGWALPGWIVTVIGITRR